MTFTLGSHIRRDIGREISISRCTPSSYGIVLGLLSGSMNTFSVSSLACPSMTCTSATENPIGSRLKCPGKRWGRNYALQITYRCSLFNGQPATDDVVAASNITYGHNSARERLLLHTEPTSRVTVQYMRPVLV